MAATSTKRQFQVEVGDVSFGDRAASTTITFPIKNKAHAGQIYDEYSYRRLVGRLLLGDSEPGQTTIDGERMSVEGAFDTHKPGLSKNKEEASIRITFDISEINTQDLLDLKRKTAWIQIDSIVDIPKPEKKSKDKANSQAALWETVPTAALGLSDTIVKELFAEGVKTIGRLVNIANGTDPKYDALDEIEKITPRKSTTILGKLDQWFATEDVENPLN